MRNIVIIRKYEQICRRKKKKTKHKIQILKCKFYGKTRSFLKVLKNYQSIENILISQRQQDML